VNSDIIHLSPLLFLRGANKKPNGKSIVFKESILRVEEEKTNEEDQNHNSVLILIQLTIFSKVNYNSILNTDLITFKVR
jgi:hypothetical protein